MSQLIGERLGNWPTFLVFLVIATVMFAWLVPQGVMNITAGRTVAPMILDEYFLTWPSEKAEELMAALGPEGRRAYQLFYMRLDFWFPVLSLALCYATLLSIAFPQARQLSWVNLLPGAMWLFDMGANLNHFSMAGSYPALSPLQIAVGPWLTLSKYVLMSGLPLLALGGLVTKPRWWRAQANEAPLR